MATNAELTAQLREVTSERNTLLEREQNEHTQVKTWLYRLLAAITGESVPNWENDIETKVADVEAKRLDVSTLVTKKRQLQAEIDSLSQANAKQTLRDRLKVDGYTDEEIATLEGG